jgi:hypothetical protein
MWQDLFRRADLITRLSQSPWSPYLDEFAAFLSEQHYSTGTIRRALVSADHFACCCQSGSSRCRTPAPPSSRSIAIHWVAQVGHGQSAARFRFMQAEAYQTSRTPLQPNPPVLCEGCSL